MELPKRTILITGAGSGMGAATAELFLMRGWQVIALDIAAVQNNAAEDVRIRRVQADVRSRESIHAALADALAPGDQIHAIANIAGIYPPTSLDSYDVETYRRIFDINVLGPVNVIAVAKPFLAPEAAIVNFASVDAFEVSPGQLFYGASKAAVVMLTKSIALELAPLGIRVNGIAPGWVETPGNAATGRMAEAAQSIPLGRVAQPSEIAEWVYILAGKEHVAFMTGETVTLSGGAVIRQ